VTPTLGTTLLTIRSASLTTGNAASDEIEALALGLIFDRTDEAGSH